MMNDEKTKYLLEYIEKLTDATHAGYTFTKEITEAIGELRGHLINDEDIVKRRYLDGIKSVAHQYNEEMRVTNEIIYALYKSRVGGEVYFNRCSGVTTSLKVLESLVDDVVYLNAERNDKPTPGINGKVLFTDPGIDIYDGLSPLCHYKIVQTDTEGFKDRSGKRVTVRHYGCYKQTSM